MTAIRRALSRLAFPRGQYTQEVKTKVDQFFPKGPFLFAVYLRGSLCTRVPVNLTNDPRFLDDGIHAFLRRISRTSHITFKVAPKGEGDPTFLGAVVRLDIQPDPEAQRSAADSKIDP
ncbi:MAG: hypothetical protein A3E80_01535 [Chlamydiae bacterium RIFCSPHIGHO2_12_FULL_49_9]|nr:MAG: hypothetical protein A3E80_01535 [Chlamydiae bacterium RIFCSPHIGHO2_12_FULL_49_9]